MELTQPINHDGGRAKPQSVESEFDVDGEILVKGMETLQYLGPPGGRVKAVIPLPSVRNTMGRGS